MKDKQITLETIYAINNKEEKFFRDLGIEENSEYIFFIEPMLKKDRKGLPSGAIDGIRNEIAELKNENKNSKVLSLVQFNKGTLRSLEIVENAMKCSKFEGSDGICIYETNPKQSSDQFNQEMRKFIDFSKDFEKYLVLEIDGNEVREKLLFALNNGIKNIIFIAGAYGDIDLWIDVSEKIRKENAKSFMVFLKRMHPTTKKAYINQAIEVGIDVIVHGAFQGRKPKKRVNYYYDRIDGYYKDKSFLPKTSIIFSDKELNELSKHFTNNTIEEYPLSRICCVREAKLFCKENRRKITLHTWNKGLFP